MTKLQDRLKDKAEKEKKDARRSGAKKESDNKLFKSSVKKITRNVSLDEDLLDKFEQFKYKNRKKKKYFLSTVLNDLLREMLDESPS